MATISAVAAKAPSSGSDGRSAAGAPDTDEVIRHWKTKAGDRQAASPKLGHSSGATRSYI